MKTLRKFLCVAMALMLALGTLAACGGSNGGVDAIKDAGVLKVGVKSDVPNFGLQSASDGSYEGLEIDIARLIAKEIFGDDTKVEFQTVTAKTRGPLLDTGEIDMVIATFTITEERKLSYNFTQPYYTDYVSLMVKKDSGIGSLADLAGKTIGVAQSATSKAAVEAAAAEAGIEVPSFNEYTSYPEIKAALDAGNIDCFCVDGSILSGYVDDSTVILDDKFSPQEYGVATKLDNKDLAEYVENLIATWKDDGTLDSLYEKWGLD